MVCLNTNYLTNLKFTHFVEVPSSDCVIGTARERTSNKTKLFLIVNGKGRIYFRNGINNIWVEIENSSEYHSIRKLVKDALADTHIPRYSTNNLSVLN